MIHLTASVKTEERQLDDDLPSCLALALRLLVNHDICNKGDLDKDQSTFDQLGVYLVWWDQGAIEIFVVPLAEDGLFERPEWSLDFVKLAGRVRIANFAF